MKILIIEDDAGILELLKMVLQESGHESASVRTAGEALSYVDEYSADLLVVDYSLPDMDGKAFIETLRERERPAPDFIVVTGREDVRIAVEMMKLGARDYIVKDMHFLDMLPEIIKKVEHEIKNEKKLQRAEEALRSSEKLLRTIADNYPNSYISIIEQDFTVGFTSGQEFKKQQLDPKQFAGASLEKVFGDKTARVREYYTKTFRGEEQSFELVIHDQSQFFRTVPLYDEDGSIPRILVVVENITERRQTEKALLESEERLNQIIYQLPYPIEVCTPDGTATLVNQAFLDMFGISSAEFIVGKYNVFQDSLIEKLGLMDTVKRVYNGETIFLPDLVMPLDSVVSEYGMTEQKVLVQEVSMFPVFRASGEIWRVVTIWKDITERKRAQEALEKRILALTMPLDNVESINFEDLFNLEDIQRLQDELAEVNGVASIITSPDGTPITRASNSCRLCRDIIRNSEKGQLNCCQSDETLRRLVTNGSIILPCMSGGLWDAGAMISVGGKHIANWLFGQVRDESQSEESIREYAREIGANEEDAAEAFWEVPAMSRERFEQIAQILSTFASQLSTMAYQNVQQARFITERKRAEKALQESEARFNAFMENLPAAVFMNDAEGNSVYVNTYMERHFDVGNRPGKSTAQHQALHEALQGKIEHVKEKDGRHRIYEIHTFPIQQAGGEDLLGGIGLDMTERIRAEEEIRSLNRLLEQRVAERTAQLEMINAELKDFAYIVSHDLKEPLRGVRQLTAWIMQDYEEQIDGPGKELLQLLGNRVKRMTQLIDGILEYSRIGHMRGDMQLLALQDLVDDVIDSLAISAHIQIVINSKLPQIWGDPTRITQVFQNVIGNAIKYNDKAQGIVTIRCEEFGNFWKISVADNGPGIETQAYEKIFKIFQTGQRRENSDSTGIGLAVVKKIIEMYGGEIWVESELGAGSTFFLTFPKNEENIDADPSPRNRGTKRELTEV